MNRMWVRYDICTEDSQGLNPFGCSCSTKAEAEAELRTYSPYYPTAFIVRIVTTRCRERIPHGSLQAV